MNEKDAQALIDLLYPYFIKKYKEDNSFKQTARLVNGTIITDKDGKKVKINPYDSDSSAISFKNPNGIPCPEGSNVLIMYYDSLKTAMIVANYNSL